MIEVHWIVLLCAAINLFMAGFIFRSQSETALTGKDWFNAVYKGLIFQLLFAFIIWPVLMIVGLAIALAGWINRVLGIVFTWKYLILKQEPPVGYAKAVEITMKQISKPIEKWYYFNLYLLHWELKKALNNWERKLDKPYTGTDGY